MQQLTPSGQQAIEDIARRHGFSPEAALSMLESVLNGHGAMAQFNHREFSGAGQWMRGGMTMVSDMFNQQLSGRVAGLCADLARLLDSQDGLFVPPAPGASADWWGPSLRWPDSTGAQGGMRYAYFSQARRLAIELNGRVTIHDTLDHRIGGFSQQQSQGGSLCLSSQHGLLDVASLPVVSVDGAAPAPGTGFTPAGAPFAAPPPMPAAPSLPAARPASGGNTGSGGATGAAGGADIFAMIEKLADLQGRGLLTPEEFAAKKTELLARL